MLAVINSDPHQCLCGFRARIKVTANSKIPILIKTTGVTMDMVSLFASLLINIAADAGAWPNLPNRRIPPCLCIKFSDQRSIKHTNSTLCARSAYGAGRFGPDHWLGTTGADDRVPVAGRTDGDHHHNSLKTNKKFDCVPG